MGWQRGASNHLNGVGQAKPGHTMFATWDPSLGDDLSVSFDRNDQSKKNSPNSTLVKGHTAHVTVQ